ncbi:MAG: hypothetical protein ABIP15_04205 [Devosia sp.]
MKTISIIAITAALALSGAAVPAFAATGAGAVPYCSSGTPSSDNTDSTLDTQLQTLATQLGVGDQQIDYWNGCLQVISTDKSGHTSMTFYDPDTLKLIATSKAS